jgi:parvulin-like peptidyl-prolyl isomerase
MKYLFPVFLALAASNSFAGSPSSADGSGEVLLDRVAAVVDGRPILYSDIRAKVEKGPLVVVSEFPLEETAPAYDRALQDSVNFELMLSKAKELEIDVRDDEVDADIKSFLEARGLNQEGLLEHLKQSQMTLADYKKDFKNQMILRKFQGRVIAPLIKITDKDVETYYLKRAGSASDLIELVLRHILISVPKGSVPAVIEAKRKLAAEVHQKIADGMAFQEAAKIYSDEQRARESGGLMAPVRAKDLIGPIREGVESLEVGQITQPIQTSLGFHLFQLDQKKFAGSQEFLSKKRQLENELRNQELVEQTRHWLSEQRQRTKIELLPE